MNFDADALALAARVLDANRAAGRMIATAESCTGGLVAVAITGIAGPGGGSPQKPVGTVVFARAERGGDPKTVVADMKHFGDRGRAEIRRQAVTCALELLLP